MVPGIQSVERPQGAYKTEKLLRDMGGESFPEYFEQEERGEKLSVARKKRKRAKPVQVLPGSEVEKHIHELEFLAAVNEARSRFNAEHPQQPTVSKEELHKAYGVGPRFEDTDEYAGLKLWILRNSQKRKR